MALQIMVYTGISTSSNKCGRSNPWLSPQEMADIVNAAIALSTSGIDTSRITPVTTSCWGGNPTVWTSSRIWSQQMEVSPTSVTVSQGDGSTGNVTINGISISGSDLREHLI